MAVTISELRVEYAEYPKVEGASAYDGGTPGSVLVGRHGLVIEPPYHWQRAPEMKHKIAVAPEEIDGLIAALHQARDLGRQMFNRPEVES